jgi:hypothetical protein
MADADGLGVAEAELEGEVEGGAVWLGVANKTSTTSQQVKKRPAASVSTIILLCSVPLTVSPRPFARVVAK